MIGKSECHCTDSTLGDAWKDSRGSVLFWEDILTYLIMRLSPTGTLSTVAIYGPAGVILCIMSKVLCLRQSVHPVSCPLLLLKLRSGASPVDGHTYSDIRRGDLFVASVSRLGMDICLTGVLVVSI